VIFILFLALAYGVELAVLFGLGNSAYIGYIGFGIALVGLLSIFLLVVFLNNVNTNIEPWKPTAQIISTGIYAYSRNPIYLMFCMISIGVGLF